MEFCFHTESNIDDGIETEIWVSDLPVFSGDRAFTQRFSRVMNNTDKNVVIKGDAFLDGFGRSAVTFSVG